MPFKLPAEPRARKNVLAALLRLRQMSPKARDRLLQQLQSNKDKPSQRKQ